MVPRSPGSGPGPPLEDQKPPGGSPKARGLTILEGKFAPKAPLETISGEFWSPKESQKL